MIREHLSGSILIAPFVTQRLLACQTHVQTVRQRIQSCPEVKQMAVIFLSVSTNSISSLVAGMSVLGYLNTTGDLASLLEIRVHRDGAQRLTFLLFLILG